MTALSAARRSEIEALSRDNLLDGKSELSQRRRDALRDLLAELRRREWQPIETAPKMRVVLLFAVTDRTPNGTALNWKMATGSYSDGHQAWIWDGRPLKDYDHHPTHWQPLPEPTAALKEPTE